MKIESPFLWLVALYGAATVIWCALWLFSAALHINVGWLPVLFLAGAGIVHTVRNWSTWS